MDLCSLLALPHGRVVCPSSQNPPQLSACLALSHGGWHLEYLCMGPTHPGFPQLNLSTQILPIGQFSQPCDKAASPLDNMQMILGLGYHRFAMVTNAEPEIQADTVLRDPNWYPRAKKSKFRLLYLHQRIQDWVWKRLGATRLYKRRKYSSPETKCFECLRELTPQLSPDGLPRPSDSRSPVSTDTQIWWRFPRIT